MAMLGPQRHGMEHRTPVSKIPVSAKLFVDSINSPLPSSKNEDNCLDVGYYLHKKSLGEGGFGKVRLATHLKTNQKVAIKMMNKEKLGQDLERVRIEIDTLKVLQHDNIAKLLQVIETDSDIYLVLEYCCGGELFDYLISKKRLTESEVRVIIKDLFGVLLYIHNRGFAHRDLKPENILFDENHKIKLIDFGLAANSSQNKSALAFLSTCCGSPAYAAPELLRGLTYSGPAVDVWSAGVLLYSLLVGQLPFDDENINNLYKKIQNGRFFMPQWLSSDVRELISLMLKTNPADRISVSRVLEHRWLKRGNSTLKPRSPEISFSSNEFDEEAFQCCRALFPGVADEKLRENIKKFHYHTATYLLLRNNPEAKKFVGDNLRSKNLAQQQRQLNATSLNTPRIASIKRKLMLDMEAVTPSSPIKRIKEVQIPISAPLPYTPRPAKTPTMQIQPKIGTPKFPALPDRSPQIVAIRNRNLPNGNLAQTPQTPVRFGEKTARRIVSPKMKTNENICQAGENIETKSIPAGGKLATIKSPLREINNKVSTASPTIVARTPVNVAKRQLKESTSKKSLLKRLMASATPARSHSPRKLNCSNHSNNITMTSYKDPQECIDRLVHTLTGRGVECKQKEYATTKSSKLKATWAKFTFVVRKNNTKMGTI